MSQALKCREGRGDTFPPPFSGYRWKEQGLKSGGIQTGISALVSTETEGQALNLSGSEFLLFKAKHSWCFINGTGVSLFQIVSSLSSLEATVLRITPDLP
jgi:hypothetical protein